MKISLIIPVHNEEGNVPIVYKEAKAVLEDLKAKGYQYEIIFINDGSTDKTLEILKELKQKDPLLRILNMDRNRGEAAGLTAGFQKATGNIIVSMDGDGQNDPKYIKDLIAKLEKGYKVATGFRLKRKENFWLRVLPSRIANWLISLFTGLKVRDNGCSLKAYLSPIPKKYQIPHGFHRFLPALFGVKNHEVCEVPIVDRPRMYGKSHYNLKRTFEVIRELFTIPFVLRNSYFYEKFFKLNFWGSILLTGLFLVLALSFSPKFWILEGLSIGYGGISYLIWKNLARFNRAQKEGVFQVEEI
ncbi:glycosyltransferase family 2 protein [Thermodesulfobacterium sp. TA1]|uniref:glycosyltransferase family 2 protein n=1 Tax=Thermodesulfobacterium sp. TA1 TaxID=2234087 RepID=UPI0012322D1D|nr:glycosyltransferase family 2 protein [Thermodesulfobacterium sp. TA1]QER41452.1 glycosyltransferase family 2 protein [Thermodesulfobacterium sp. TA1]